MLFRNLLLVRGKHMVQRFRCRDMVHLMTCLTSEGPLAGCLSALLTCQVHNWIW